MRHIQSYRSRSLCAVSNMVVFGGLLALVISLSVVYGHPASSKTGSSSRDGSWSLKDFKALVTFGDSYTDESRAAYFASNLGKAPPTGWVEPIVGGLTLPNSSAKFS